MTSWQAGVTQASSTSEVESASESTLTAPLLTSGPLTEAEDLQSAREAELASPGAVAEREASRTEFEGLNAKEAAKVAAEAFPAAIHELAGGPPSLPKGQKITNYLSADTAQLDLGDGEHGLVESMEPMAMGSTDAWQPIDLGLSRQGDGFEPENPLVDVRIPARLDEGVQAPALGLSLTPLDAQGAPLDGAAGTIDGATVFFANTQTDADTIVKPSTFGFAVDTSLRSVESPTQLFFRVGLPTGASLAQAEDGSSTVQIVKEGETIATIPSPTAQDAAGTPVPVSMSVSGDTLALTVKAGAGEFQYPIDVDPEFNTLSDSTVTSKTWSFSESGGGWTYGECCEHEMWMSHSTTGSSEWAALQYRTLGDSKIYKVNTVTQVSPTEVTNELFWNAQARAYLELEGSGGYENSAIVAQSGVGIKEEAGGIHSQVCATAECSPANGTEHNLVRLVGLLTGSLNSNLVEVRLNSAAVWISQPKETHTTVNYDTTHPELAGTTNVLYGSTWLGPNAGAFEFKANDAGIGVAEAQLEWFQGGSWKRSGEAGAKKRYLGTGSCAGIQCAANQSEKLNYATTLHTIGWTNGEDRIRVAADDAMEHTWSSEHAEGEAVIKFDNAKPHGLKLSGLPGEGEEVDLGEVEGHVKVEASDGEGSVPSSGIKSIALGIDGREIGKPAGSCPQGPCTASAEWALNGADLGVGVHVLTVVATDKANNVESKEFTLHVHHATPVTMGPGSVNPESGDFALGATDVDVSGGAGELGLTRHYDSRNPQEGAEGPLGPQWTVSLGSLASLEVLPDKSVMVVGPEGITHFSVTTGGTLEAPEGDKNLTLSLHGSEYLLKNTTTDTTTKFTLPTGATSWMPTVSEGSVATDTMTDTYQSVEAVDEFSVPSAPWGITSGPGGSLWYSESCCESSAIGEITPAGVKTEFTSLPVNAPAGITQGADGNVWFVNSGTRKVDKLTPAGHLTEYESPGNGEWGHIAEGTDGDVWLTHRGGEASSPGTIVKMNTSGEATPYSVPAESNPEDIKPGPEGDMWFTNGWCRFTSGRICKIGKITPSGTVTEYPLERWALPEDVVAGPNGEQAVWFPMLGPAAEEVHIVKMTASGVITKYPLPAKSYPRGITVGSDGNLWFTEWEAGKVGKITPSGTITEYALPTGSKPFHIVAGPDEKLWFTEFGTHQIGTISTTGRITEPTLELAPHSTATCAPKKLEKGCRALEFTYAKVTTAKGEAKSEWGEFKGRLMKASFIAYNPSTKEVEPKPVAEYSYDGAGRLRAEWDPRLEHPLKMIYGYDSYGHITALTAPGQESLAFTYGAIPGDASTGRLLKMAQAQASTGLWGGQMPASSEAPKLSGTPAVGVRMAVSNGTWSNAPVSHAYQWEDCSASGDACTPILGATNENYTPTASDVGHTLIAEVTSTNGGGTVGAVSAASTVIAGTAGSYTQTVDGTTSVNAVSCIPTTTDCVIADSVGKAFYSTHVSATTSATWTTWYGLGASSNAAVACPSTQLCTIANGGNVYWASSLGGTWLSAFSPTYPVIALSCPATGFCVDGQGGNGGFIRYSTNPASTTWTAEAIGGTSNINGVACLSSLFCTAVDSLGNVHAATTNAQIESASWTSTSVDGTTALNGIACTSTTSCVAVDGVGNVLNLAIGGTGAATVVKHNVDATNDLTAISCSSSTCTTVDAQGNIFISTNSGSSWTKRYTLGTNLTSVSCASTTLCLAADTTGKITAFNPAASTPQEGEAHSPQPGSTIDYNVPIEGSEAPNQLGLNKETGKPEPEKWGQKDDPAYATAIFPPDEPQGWPASQYERATISYMDGKARTVNVAVPSGGIGTQEYNKENAVMRSLSPASRASAMKEGCISEKECKSAEVSKLLDTQSTYSEGQLLETRGPQHTVKLVKGKEGKPEEVLARNHVKYYYDEGAPGGEEYDLVTKTEDSAETANKEEFDKRTATTSYGGQGTLGWSLREPTSTTTDPGGLSLTTSTKYNEAGQVTESKSAAASGSGTPIAPAFSSTFATKGTGNGQLTEPRGVAIAKNGNVYVVDAGDGRVEEFSPSGAYLAKFGSAGKEKAQLSAPYTIAVDSKGNVWISDTGNNRIDEFNEKREFVQAFGWAVANAEEKLEVCTTTCKAGSAGAGAGQFNEPKGIAVTPSGAIFVSDAANNRIEKFTEKGEFAAAFGFGVSNGEAKFETCTSSCKAGVSGSGPGQFNNPRGAAASASGNIWVTDAFNNRLEQFTEKGEYVSQIGTKGTGNGQFKEPKSVTVAANGTILVTDNGNDRVQEFASSGAFLASFGGKGSGNGQFEESMGVAMTAAGTIYVGDLFDGRIEVWVPAISGNPAAHEGKTYYYTAKAEAEVEACRNHLEWVGLPCETTPVAQPGAGGPEVPVTTTEYNMWNEPEVVVETFGSGATAKTREKKTEYDPAGRAIAVKETSTIDTALPKINYEYSSESGVITKMSATVGEATETIKSAYNTLGQMTEYTDAAGATTTFEYEKEKDARLIKVKDPKGSQTYKYDNKTGFLTELVDSAVGTVKAEYDIAGRMTSEIYPNALTAIYTHDQSGASTGIEYKKTAHCKATCPEAWFSDSTVPSIHGETLNQNSTLSKESYAYDAAGRLTETQETPTGEYCKTRSYGYDEESNRLTLTTREPNSSKECATEGGSTEWHTYDTANRMTDTGIQYETFGNITELPASDAGGSKLISQYYVDNQVAKQEQNGEKIEYKLDPESRTLEAISTGNTAATVISHYDNTGGALSWTSEESGAKWTRNIPGIGGSLMAIEHSGKETEPALQLHDLQGNVVAEVADNEAETKLSKTYNSTEFGVPSGKEAPPTYAWLGASGVAGELPSGVITQDGVTYVPQTGQSLQTEGVALLSIENTATPFTRPVEAWVGSRAGEGVAREAASAEQENAEREAANQPPGVIPSGPGWWCGGEYGPCEGEGGGAGDEGGGGCVGMNACAAGWHWHKGVVDEEEKGENSFGCEIWGSWGHGEFLAGEIAGFGHFTCGNTPPAFEMQVEAYGEGAPEFEGHEVMLGTPGKSHKSTERWHDASEGEFSKTWKCPATGSWYHLWFWGRQMGSHGKTQWSSTGWEEKIGSCVNRGPVDITPVGQATEPG